MPGALTILKQVTSLPTAPFAEQRVIEYARRFAAARPRLRLSEDRTGNLLIELPSPRRSPRWVFTAHMDHPGFVARKMRSSSTLEVDFRGWVHINYVRGAKVRFFGPDREITGVVTNATSEQHDRLTVPNRVMIRVNSPVSPGSPGMFDLGVGRVSGNRFRSRAIDDLAGLAAALTMIDQLQRHPPRVPVAVLLTRAEEEGFIGAVAAAKSATLLRMSDRIIAIECSAMQPYAPQGKGAIIRVGDRTSIFNSAITYFLTQQAESLAKKDKNFKFQRALMPGGTCEATVYDVYGYTAGSICIALGNYHNMDREKMKLAAEYIDLNDWKNMVKLFVHVSQNAHLFTPDNRALRDRIEKRFNRLRRFLSP